MSSLFILTLLLVTTVTIPEKTSTGLPIKETLFQSEVTELRPRQILPAKQVLTPFNLNSHFDFIIINFRSIYTGIQLILVRTIISNKKMKQFLALFGKYSLVHTVIIQSKYTLVKLNSINALFWTSSSSGS